MLTRNFQAAASYSLDNLSAAVTLANGAILVDDYDDVVFDEVLRKYPLWDRIDKRLAPGENTNGFDQTAVGSARSAPVRNLSYSATSSSRAARTARAIKAIVANLEFTIFDRSVYQQQGRRFGDIEQKDINDLITSVLRRWQTLAYDGDITSDSDEFDGLKALLGAGTTVLATASVLKAIQDEIVSLTNSTARDVMPTAIYTNAQVVLFLEQELLKAGNKLVYAPIQIGSSVFQVAQLATPVGFLPLFADPYNSVITGTPNTYPTYIVSEDKLSWQYVEVLGQGGAEPKTFELSMATDLDTRFATIQFGALELLGGTNHHSRLNVEHRSTVVDPTA